MELIKTQNYGGNVFSFYSTKRKDIFMTINELALGFGYKSKNGIEQILNRNPRLKDKKYSFIMIFYIHLDKIFKLSRF